MVAMSNLNAIMKVSKLERSQAIKLRTPLHFSFKLRWFLSFIYFASSLALAKEYSYCKQKYEEVITKPGVETVEKAVKAWSDFEKPCSDTDEYNVYLADIYMYFKESKKAKEISETIIKINKNKNSVRTAEDYLMVIDLGENKIESAMEKSKILIKKYPDWYAGYLDYGMCLIKNGDSLLEAKKYFEQANELEETAYANCWLAFVYYYEFRDYRTALALYKKAFELDKGATAYNREASAVAADSAIILGEWGTAQSILEAQRIMDPTVENFPKYSILKAKIDAYEKNIVPKLKNNKIIQK